MAKTFKLISLACLIGATLAACFFFSIKETPLAKGKNIAYAFQVGVYSQEQNALKAAQNYKPIKIFKSPDYYRLFVGITLNNQELLKEYFARYNVYQKEIWVDDVEAESLAKYDEILKRSSQENYDEIIGKMLEVVNSELQN